jgi:hypothetical protein
MPQRNLPVADDPPGIGGYGRSLFDWRRPLGLGKDGALVC